MLITCVLILIYYLAKINIANPQKENGYTAVANEIMEALIKSNLNGTELAVVLLILRNTYGWNKVEDEISLSQFLKFIPVTKPSLCKALKNLKLVKIIKLVKKGKSKICSNRYSFNKNYEEWQLVKKTKLVKVYVPTSKETFTPTSKEIFTYKRKKKNNTKENSYSQIFQHWNNLKITEHKKLTDTMKRAIDGLLKEEITEENILKGIDVYSEIYKSKKTFFSYKWTLEEFLKRKNGCRVFIYKTVNDYLRNEFKGNSIDITVQEMRTMPEEELIELCKQNPKLQEKLKDCYPELWLNNFLN